MSANEVCRIKVAILPETRAQRVIELCKGRINANLHGMKQCRIYTAKSRFAGSVALWLEVELPWDSLIALGYVQAVVDLEPLLLRQEAP